MELGSNRFTYEPVDDWAQLPDGESFVDVASVCIDDDRVYVLNRGDRRVQVFDLAGEHLAAWGDGHFSDRPHGMGIAPDGTVWCTDDDHHTVMQFSPDGELLATLGTRGQPSATGYRDVPDIFERLASITDAAGPFNQPTGVTVAGSGDVFVADGYGNARVHRFDADGELRSSWGAPGADVGEFRLPHSVHTDDDGRVWVTDRENSRIQVFTADGEFVEAWIDLIRPTDLCLDGDVVYVSELCKRVSVFSTDGELLARWGNERLPVDDPLFVAPHAIAVDSRGDLYVGEVPVTYSDVDRGARTLQKFERVT